MKYPKARQPDRATTRCGRSPVNPYCIGEVGLTPPDPSRDRAGSIAIVVNRQ